MGKTVGVASWVERLKANDASLTSVTVFRGRLFGPDEAAAVSAALRTNTHLLELYASGHAMDAATAATLAEALAENTTLQSLCVGDDAFGDAGLAALAPGVAKSTSLRSLDLENKGIGDAGAAALGDYAGHRPLGRTPSLRAINLSRNAALGPEGLAAARGSEDLSEPPEAHPARPERERRRPRTPSPSSSRRRGAWPSWTCPARRWTSPRGTSRGCARGSTGVISRRARGTGTAR